MTRSKLINLALLSGLLLIPAWYKTGTGLLLLFAFIPLLFVENYLYENKIVHRSHKIFFYACLTFFTWNVGTTWWLLNATGLALLAFSLNTLLMSTIFWLFHITHRYTNSAIGYFALFAYWMVYEHFYMNGEINWPWLNLGNGFANDIHFIQWYEYTGSFGGTLWILLTNIMGFILLKRYFKTRNIKGIVPNAVILGTVILVPIIISLTIFKTYVEKNDPKEIVILQPNIDPYLEKFGGMDMTQQMDILLSLADSITTQETDFIVAPETFINDNIWANDIYTNPSTERIYNYLLNNFNNATFIVGIHYNKLHNRAANKTLTAQVGSGMGINYNSYNAVIQIDTTKQHQVYVKSKLVVGVEKMPFPQYLSFLRRHTIPLGGTFRSHVPQDHRENFYALGDSTGISPVICYESIFGEFVTDYIKLGSDFIFVITNDGWWGNTPGHRQHHSYSRLRAIETRRSVARSANTGISSLINQRGQILQSTNYWVPTVIRGNLNANNKLTFYTRYGDYIARFAYYFSLLLVLYTGYRIIFSRKRKVVSSIK